jgi:plasmid stabilization system protein ParE
MFKIECLPLAQRELRDITDYITDTLKAPNAAMDLLNAPFLQGLPACKRIRI